MNKLMIVTCAAALGLAAFADTPESSYSFTYQAALRDEQGNVIKGDDGNVKRDQLLTVRLWDAPQGGNLLWGRQFAVFTDETGLFNLEVSDGGSLITSAGEENPKYNTLADALSASAAGSVYLGIKVDGSANEISPRQRIFAVPFASVANEARKLKGEVTVDGSLTVGGTDGVGGVKITKDGISQTGGSASSDFANVQVSSTLNAGKIEVVGTDLSSFRGDTEFSGKATFKGVVKVDNKNADFTVASKNFSVDTNGNTTVAGTLSAKSLNVGGAALMPVPLGGIIMWSSETPPSGEKYWASEQNDYHWAICDGTDGTGGKGNEINGFKIPDLRGRFIVGADLKASEGSGENMSYAVGATGGCEKVSLQTDEMPSHMHLYITEMSLASALRQWSNTDVWTKIGHSSQESSNGRPKIGFDWHQAADALRIVETGRTGGDGTVISSGDDVGYPELGHAKPHENRPPYYALFYIMRVR